MLRGKDGELSVAQRLVCGAAGCVAILCCFPLDVLRTRCSGGIAAPGFVSDEFRC